jgi:hypothetical protein
MGQLNSLLRSIANRALNHRPVQPDAPASGAAASGTLRPLHIATSVSIIAQHRRRAVSVADAREAIQQLAAAKWPTRAERQLIDELVSATGLELSELAEVTKEWLPW